MLLERGRELRAIDAFLTAVAAGEGRVLLVCGPAGIGKSTLLREAWRRARGLEVLTARGGDLERDYGYGIVRQLLERRVRQASNAERAELLAGAASLARPVLLEGPGRAGAGADAHHASSHGLYWLLDGLANTRPLLMTVDDAQWADVDSLRFLRFLAARLDGLPVGVLVAWRTGEPGGITEEMLESLGTDVLRPAPLSARASARMARDRLDDADDDLCAACHDATGGNPFLLGELLNAVRAGETVGEAGPAAVARNLLLRLERVGETAAAVARALAVLDVDADLRLVGGNSAAVASLQQVGILAPDGLAYAHPILRNAVYRSMPRAERDRLHLAAARELVDPDRAAAHLLVTEPGGDPWVAEQLTAAGDRALERGAVETAISLFERAVAEQSDPPAELVFRLGCAEQLGARPNAEERLQAAVEQGEGATRRQAARWLARQRFGRLMHREAIALLDAIIPEQDRDWALRLQAERAAYGAIVDATAQEAAVLDELVLAEHDGDSEAERMLCVSVALSRVLGMRGTADEAGALIDRALREDRFLHLMAESSVPFWACGVLLWCGRIDEAKAQSDAALAEARRRGGAIFVSSASTWRALAAWAAGDLRDAEAHAQAAVEAAAGRFPLAQLSMHGLLVEILRQRGEFEAADALLDRAGLSEVMPPYISLAAWLPKGRAELRFAQGRHAEGQRDVEHLLAAARLRGGFMPGVLPDPLVDEAERWGDPGYLGQALRVEGVRTGDPARLERAVQLLRASPFRFDLARALVDFGAALRRDNQRRAAREPLAEGMELAHRCGSPLLTERARDELRAAGAKPRQVTRSGADSLTPSERRVAQLAAGGLSNREIAQAQFVTTKTVETHLRHIFQKLDLVSRTQLPQALGIDPVRNAVVLIDEAGAAVFESAEAALAYARSQVRGSPRRAAVQVGEVEVTNGAARGPAVEAARRLLARAAPGEVAMANPPRESDSPTAPTPSTSATRRAE